MDDSNRRWLENHRTRVQSDRNLALTRESRWSWARLALFLIAATSWFPLSGIWPVALTAVGLCAGLFVFTVKRHIVAKEAREFFDRLLIVVDESLQRCGGQVVVIRCSERPHGKSGDASAGPDDWEQIDRELPPTLRPVVPPNPAVSAASPSVDRINADAPPSPNALRTWPLTSQERDDLDLYSEQAGIFGLLNRSSTMLGSLRIRDTLENPLLEATDIHERQAAVSWLAAHPAERLRILAGLASLRGEDKSMQKLIGAVQSAKPVLEESTLMMLRVWSTLTGAFVVWSIIGMAIGEKNWLWPALALMAVNGIIGFILRGRIHEQLDPWQNVLGACAGYLESAREGAADLPGDAPQLSVVRDKLRNVLSPAALPGLRRRVGWSEGGGMVGELLNLAFMYELHVADAILRRTLPFRRPLLEGLSALADLEVRLSLACFAWEQPINCWPQPVKQTSVVIKRGQHVLIAPLRAVPNDVDLGTSRRLMLITGSNMSGKSTYLRMTGVNVLLAQVGTVAIAQEMTWSPLGLITDLRAQDNLSRDESYFLAEVRQLRRMFAALPDAAPILGIIDEPLRGTNSQEQVAASLAVVEHLARSGNLFMVATHDEKLTELANDGLGENFHFQEDLGSSGMTFDYCLRDGPARTRNALRVLEREQYPREVVERAKWWLGSNQSDRNIPSTPSPTERKSIPQSQIPPR